MSALRKSPEGAVADLNLTSHHEQAMMPTVLLPGPIGGKAALFN